MKIDQATYSVRTYPRKTNTPQNKYTIRRGANNTSIQKWEINYFQTKIISCIINFKISDESIPFDMD